MEKIEDIVNKKPINRKNRNAEKGERQRENENKEEVN